MKMLCCFFYSRLQLKHSWVASRELFMRYASTWIVSIGPINLDKVRCDVVVEGYAV
jgi:hypothetical protein